MSGDGLVTMSLLMAMVGVVMAAVVVEVAGIAMFRYFPEVLSRVAHLLRSCRLPRRRIG